MGAPWAEGLEEGGRKLNWKKRWRRSLDGSEAREAGGGKSGSLTWWVGPVEGDEGWERVEPLVQVPERAATPGLGFGSCPFHRECRGREERVPQGHSGSLRGPWASSVARLRAAQSCGLRCLQVPAHTVIHSVRSWRKSPHTHNRLRPTHLSLIDDEQGGGVEAVGRLPLQHRLQAAKLIQDRLKEVLPQALPIVHVLVEGLAEAFDRQATAVVLVPAEVVTGV